MSELEAMCKEHGFVFLKGDGRLTLEERHYLFERVVSIYQTNVPSLDVVNPSLGLEGRVYTKNEYELMGVFGGQVFYAEVNKIGVKDKIDTRFLILLGVKTPHTFSN